MDETPPIASINSDSNELAFSKDTPDPSEAENVNEDENGMDEIQNETESIDAEAGTVESEALNKGESLEEELFNDNSNDTASKLKSATKIPNRTAGTDTQHIQVEAEHIIEYEWPLKSGSYYFIQEQISLLLDVKSFKRKYPQLFRRSIEALERDYLIEQKELAKCLSSHLINQLTALRSTDVYDLMQSEYPEIYAAYQKAISDRKKQEVIQKQKELELIKSDVKKMEELRKKALKSASKFNQTLQEAIRMERRHFFDIQTAIIQSPRNMWKRLSPEYSKPSLHPVALISGQYISHFRKLDKCELNKLPLNTIVDSSELIQPRRDASPPAIHVANEELSKDANNVANLENGYTASPNVSVKEELEQKDFTPSAIKGSRRSSTASNGGPPAKKPRKNSLSNVTRVLNFDNSTAADSATPSPIPEEEEEEADENLCIICNVREHEAPPDAFISTVVDGERAKPAVTPFLRCSECFHHMHAYCINMSKEMFAAVQTYRWRCAECKECTICDRPDQEDEMICCDLCDRGYHTFCIGLVAPPAGPFICMKCAEKKN